MSGSTAGFPYVHATLAVNEAPPHDLIGAVFAAMLLLLLAGCGGSSSGQAPTPSMYTVGASVSGLSGTGLVLQLSADATLPVAANGNATFDTSLASGQSYQVSVQTQPSSPQQVCSVANGTGTVGASNVLVAVTCLTMSYSVDVSVSGLAGSGLVLALNAGNNLAVSANGDATFAVPVPSGTNYQVTVATQPASPQQACVVPYGSGTIGASNVTIVVTCVNSGSSYTVGVTVQGSSGSGLVLQLNGGSNLPIMANGQAVFAALIVPGTPYTVTVQAQPSSPAQTCVLSRASGTIINYNVNTALISCITAFSASGAPTVSTLYSFGTVASFDGSVPTGTLIQASDGNLYGTTSNGGTANLGTVFRVTLGGNETVLHSFDPNNGDDPTTQPRSGDGFIQASDGSFYVTLPTLGNQGGIVKIGAGGAATPFYSFGSTPGDGAIPQGLIQGTDGNLYGTTASGGSSSAVCPNGCGTVFKMTPSGIETILYYRQTSRQQARRAWRDPRV
jgi:uncharacterized repeat protein (TIGR03803 family)